jgi:hypothetical protein
MVRVCGGRKRAAEKARERDRARAGGIGGDAERAREGARAGREGRARAGREGGARAGKEGGGGVRDPLGILETSSFLPSAARLVSTRIGTRVDAVS